MNIGLIFTIRKLNSCRLSGCAQDRLDRRKCNQLEVSRKVWFSFCQSKGIVSGTTLVPAPGCPAVNATYYTSVSLKKLVTEIHKKWAKAKTLLILLLHDDASSDNVKLAARFLKDHKLRLLPHPPYSPDPTPWDSFLLQKLKEKVKGRTFTTQKELSKAVFDALKVTSGDGLFFVFQSCRERCK